MASLSLQGIQKIYPNGFHAVKDFNLEIADKEFIIFVGPSGCGKSTTLRMIAGLEDISGGTLKIDGKVMNDVEPKDRDIAMVFQNYALYPHMTVYDNMAFGLKLRKVPKDEIDKKVREAAKILDLDKLLDRKLRVQMRIEISKLHENLGATIIYVTHDQTEAMTLGTRIVVMKDGVVQQVDTPQALYNTPCNLFVAGFIGSPQMNFMDAKCTIKGNDVTLTVGKHVLKVPASKKQALIDGGYDGKTVVLGIRPEDVHDSQAFISNSPDSVIESTIKVYELLGAEVFLYFDVEGTQLTARVNPRTTLRTGDHAVFALDMEKIHLFDKDTELTITEGAVLFSEGAAFLPSIIILFTEITMANTSELEKGLNELKRLTGITLAVTAKDSEQEQMALEQIRCLCLAYREKYNKNDFLMGLMTGGIPSYDVQQRAARLHIAPEEDRILFLIEMKEPDEIVAEILKNLFPSQTKAYIVPVSKERLAVLYPFHETKDSKDSADEHARHLAHAIVDTLNAEALAHVQVSFSQMIPSLLELSGAFREASLALKVGKLFYPEQTVFPYNELGIGRLIYQLPVSLCESFLQEVFLDKIPDKLDDETLLTINRFLQNNLNIAETSRQLHMHRNTLIYRLEQIEKRTGLDLRQFEDAMTFKIATMVMNYLHAEKEKNCTEV